MIDTNPFAELAAYIPVATMQGYVVLMVLLVIGGTILDMIHKKSAKYFFENAKKAEKNAKRTVSGGEKARLPCRRCQRSSDLFRVREHEAPDLPPVHDVRIHPLRCRTAVLIFGYRPRQRAGIWPLLWHLGALMLCFGGYWFWFVIRVDVSSEGNPGTTSRRGDLFILSLLTTATFGLLWSFTQGGAHRLAVLRPVHRLQHHSVRHRVLVQVCTHVLQARRGLPEEVHQGRWFARESARSG